MLSETLSIVAGLLTVVGSTWYIWSVLHGFKPKWTTWFIWGALDVVVLAGMWESGRETNWQIIVCTVAAWLIWLLALRYGVSGWDRVDTICSIGAVVGIILLRSYPSVSLGIGLIAMWCGAGPTYASTWRDPRREPYMPWLVGCTASLLLLIAVPWTFAAAAQPAAFLMINGMVPVTKFIRQRR